MSNHIDTSHFTPQTFVDPFPGKDAAEAIFVNCDRCGGVGHIAGFEPIYGGVCFGCNGHKGSMGTIGGERKKAKGKVAYANTKERKLIKSQQFHNEQMEAAEAAHPILAGWFEAMNTDTFLTDLWVKAFNYELSEAQVNAAAAGMQRTADRKAQRQAEHDALPPAPAGKERISGTVVAVKHHEGNYGDTWKMIVLDARNFKVWVTVPAALWDQLRDQRADRNYNPAAEDFVGRQVAFNATLEVSDTDSTFAFAKRPTKALLQAELTEQAPEEAHAAEEATEAPAAPAAATPAPATEEAPADCMGGFTKGDTVTTKDGTEWTVVGPAQNNTTVKLTREGKSTFRFAHNLTAA